ncbi:MAG: 50S ribosomal protein L10 [Patescibacteria group bacterium]|nr:50S ribosomal protein L10 [Patescibacteria group bacterium]
MPKTRQQKADILQELQDRLAKIKTAVFSNYHGLSVQELEELRQELNKNQADYMVAPKTLFNLAAKENKIENVNTKELNGSLGVAFGYGDEVSTAKVLSEFKKKHEKLNIVGGIFENQFITAEKVEALAKIPTRPELLAKVVGSLKAPISGLANVLQGNLRNLVYVLNAIKDNKA